MTTNYQVNYTGLTETETGTQTITQAISIDDAFHVAAGESADAFKANGGDSYDCTDLDYEVTPAVTPAEQG